MRISATVVPCAACVVLVRVRVKLYREADSWIGGSTRYPPSSLASPPACTHTKTDPLLVEITTLA